jgi:hypothetical protein
MLGVFLLLRRCVQDTLTERVRKERFVVARGVPAGFFFYWRSFAKKSFFFFNNDLGGSLSPEVREK